ncbi:helix-turn-helix transcriptional regulator [Corynebacterium sp. CCM 8863]|uniref:Helix-turn-helix transcriptional regulator n=1 Tax=Corynebacterium meridianum TaxID=2765363 RepID=A0A934M826_9CORY|nr:helix-turn-helix transcriptional regulator [Corynebacterium meridianum]MCK7678469.1 helix-turn-helix transcriptional regulator [Corynebacterium meridianum]
MVDNRLRQLREQHGLSQQKLADALGVSRQTVISIEKGRYHPSLPLAFQLAERFSCRIEDIFIPHPGRGADRGAVQV